MTEKFELYDVIGVLVPGILLVCVVAVFFPSVVPAASQVPFPEAFAVLALTALAIVAGHTVQALASIAEPLIARTWGGQPSDRAFTSGLGQRYLPADTGQRIKAKLSAACTGATDRSLFIFAMQRAEAAGGRVPSFNALYGYHRALLVLTLLVAILFATSFAGGLASHLTRGQVVGVFISLALFLLLVWHRTKQRACYYVREVLLTAERDLESPKGKE